MDKTGISWCQNEQGEPGSTWNPTKGCKVCSPGCKNCYAMAIAGRFSGPGQPFAGLVTIGKNKKAVWNGEGYLDLKNLLKPLHWRKGRGVFVDSMSDLFFEPITNEEIAACFGVMAAARQHRYMILTKRAKRMREWYRWFAQSLDEAEHRYPGDLAQLAWCYTRDTMKSTVPIESSVWNSDMLNRGHDIAWPLPNVWQGVSVDDRKHGIPRIEELQHTDAAVRFLSIEPLLEDLGELDLQNIHWVIIGCESGRGARTCKVEWIRNIVEQAKAQGVKIWLKQAEESTDCGEDRELLPEDDASIAFGDGSKLKGRRPGGNHIIELPYLDDVQYRELP